MYFFDSVGFREGSSITSIISVSLTVGLLSFRVALIMRLISQHMFGLLAERFDQDGDVHKVIIAAVVAPGESLVLPQGPEGLHLLGVHGDLAEGGGEERGRGVTKVAVEEDSGSGNIIDVTLAAVCSQHLQSGRWFIILRLYSLINNINKISINGFVFIIFCPLASIVCVVCKLR